ncbi:endonuclease V [Nitrososphaera sp.]|uniref:endonuclease V n=1 Tax=Nitrososphaera sp. TaxID=1971748 RepID=UPI0017D58F18|nr:endonuclease V [Nitrososphaera sp.]NWG36636.1 endonuclease V [Nitrososphaera sp.]
MRGFRLPSTPEAAKRQQAELAKKVVASDDFGQMELFCGVDVSYRQGIAHCAAVVVDRQLNVVERAMTKSAVKQPYIPGLFVLREAGPALRTLKKLERYDLLLVDGHGRLHPRRCGLACYLGVALDKPAIGVAKSLLCGTVKGDNVEIDGEVLGYVIQGRKKLYVSVGNRISLESAVSAVKGLTKKGEWLPEPLRLADAYSRL